MVRVAYIKNPLTKKEIDFSNVDDGTLLSDVIPSNGTYIVSVNGRSIETLDIVLRDGDQVVYAPYLGKHAVPEVIATILTIVVAVYAPAAAASIASALNISSAIGTALITASLVTAGLVIINALVPVQPKLGQLNSESFDTSPTYGWAGTTTVSQIGRPIPILYGQYNVGGNIYSIFKDYPDENSEMLYMGLVLCEGEIEPISENDITVNNIPFPQIERAFYDYRTGTLTQQAFGKTVVFDAAGNKTILYTDENAYRQYISVNSEVTNATPVTATTQSNDLDRIDVLITLPQGLFYANNSGGLDNRDVYLKIEYKRTSDSTWTTYYEYRKDVVGTEYEWRNDSIDWVPQYQWSETSPGAGWYKTGRSRPIYNTQWFDTVKISGNTTHKIRKRYTLSVNSGDTYDIKITKVTADVATSREINTVFFEAYIERNLDSLSHPYIAKLALGIEASKTLGGSINSVITKIRRKPIDVYDDTGAFYATVEPSNPAWIAWDILTNRRYGAGIPYESIDFQAFVDFATWCNELVSFTFNGSTLTRHRAEFHGLIDFSVDVWTTLQRVCMVGRATPVLKGDKYSVIIDKPRAATQIFSMGNIVAGSYKTTYVGKEDIADIIEVKFYDFENDYRPSFVQYPSNVSSNKKQTIDAIGVTQAHLAYRLARYFYGTTQTQKRVVEWDSTVDALACEVGDVVYFAHDVPNWGESGRTLAGSTTTHVVLDEPVTIDPTQTYTILIRHSDDTIEQRTLDTAALSAGDYTEFDVTQAFSTAPVEYSVYTIGTTTKNYQKLRIVNISRSVDNNFHIIAVDYNESILLDDSFELPTFEPPVLDYPTAQNIIVSEHLEKRKDGTIVGFIDLSWEFSGSMSAKFDIYAIPTDGGAAITLAKQVESTSISINALSLQETKEYTFKVVSVLTGWTQSLNDAAGVNYIYQGKSAPPSDVTGLSYNVIFDSGIEISWTPVDDVDLAGYNIYYNGVLVADRVTSTTYNLGFRDSGTVEIEAIDTSGNVSVNRASIVVTVEKPVILDVGYTFENSKIRVEIIYNDGSFAPLAFKLNNNGNIKIYANNIFELPQPSTGTFTYGFTVVMSGQIESAEFVKDVTVTPPTISNGVASIDNVYVVLSWESVAGSNPIDHYRVTNTQTNETFTTRETTIKLKVASYETVNFSVVAVDTRGFESSPLTISNVFNVPNITNLTYTFIDGKVKLDWEVINQSFPIEYYVVTHNGIDHIVNTNSYITPADWLGSETFTVKAVDIHGQSGQAQSTTVTIDSPNSPIVNGRVDKTVLVLTWSGQAATLPISHYVVCWDSQCVTVDALAYSIPITWQSKTFTIKAVDIVGNESATTTYTHTVTLPEVTSVSYQVLDNNVILTWDYVLGSLPFDTAIIKRGTDFATAEVIGTKTGTFTLIFETSGGEYTYWVAIRDSAGNIGTAKSVTVTVSSPPNYILKVNWNSDFSGTKTNAHLSDGKLWAPINITETYDEHFSTRGWTSPQDQIDAGYPIWSQPYPQSASYIETFDYGVTLASSMVNVDYTVSDIIGTGVSISVDVELSDDGTTWTLYQNTRRVYGTQFRYVRITVHFTSTDDKSLVALSDLSVRLDSKEISDFGNATCNAADTNGTFIPFNKNFVDVDSITVTYQGTNSVTHSIEFNDVPYPTGFNVYLFDSQTGARVSGDIYWQARGY